MALDEDLGAGIGKSRGLASQQFVLREEKRGQRGRNSVHGIGGIRFAIA